MALSAVLWLINSAIVLRIGIYRLLQILGRCLYAVNVGIISKWILPVFQCYFLMFVAYTMANFNDY